MAPPATALLNPELTPELENLSMRIRYRGHSLDLPLTRDAITIHGGDPDADLIALQIYDKLYEFVSGMSRAFRLKDGQC